MDLDSHWWWLLLALLLGIGEIVAPGFFLLWLGTAALLTGFATLGFQLPFAAQLALFAVGAIGSVYIARRWFTHNGPSSSDPMLNDRAARLIGQTVVVTDALAGGSGRVGVGDGSWPARGPDAGIGARLRVIAIESGALIVEPLE